MGDDGGEEAAHDATEAEAGVAFAKLGFLLAEPAAGEGVGIFGVGIAGIVPEEAGFEEFVGAEGGGGAGVEVEFAALKGVGAAVGEGDFEVEEVGVRGCAGRGGEDLLDFESVGGGAFEGDAGVVFGGDLIGGGIEGGGFAPEGADGFVAGEALGVLIEDDTFVVGEGGCFDTAAKRAEFVGDAADGEAMGLFGLGSGGGWGSAWRSGGDAGGIRWSGGGCFRLGGGFGGGGLFGDFGLGLKIELAEVPVYGHADGTDDDDDPGFTIHEY